MIQNIFDLSLEALKQSYKSGVLSPETLVEHLLTASLQCNEDNIWITLQTRGQLQPYLDRLAEKSPDELPLYGVPFAIKDNIDLAGIATTAACPEAAFVPDQSAHVVQKLIDAGAIPLGKTNLDQFATGLVGVRSPHGPTRNSFDPSYISGGSSSGSSVAVAKGLVSFSLGTDTAGSGRIPAAFNNLVGVKPSRGLLSNRGMMPACESLDCMTIFALNPDDAANVLSVAEGEDEADPWSRSKPLVEKAGWPQQLKLGVPKQEQLEFFGDQAYEQLFAQTVEHWQGLGADIIEVDLAPFLDAARLLYEGPWVSERYLACEDILKSNPEAMLEVTRSIIAPGSDKQATDVFRSQYRLQALKRVADETLAKVDAILTPTAPTHYTIEQVLNDPVQLNSNLGTYTNFMNLLDYAALAVPAGFTEKGLPFGVTLFAGAFSDEFLLSLGQKFMVCQSGRMGATDFTWQPSSKQDVTGGCLEIAVCGAHLSGMPLNSQLTERGAALVEATHTAKGYRLFALAGGPPFRPGLVRDDSMDTSIAVEVWAVPLQNVGSFLARIPAPLGLGTLTLASGREVTGFICEPQGVEGAEEITHLGGWRAYITLTLPLCPDSSMAGCPVYGALQGSSKNVSSSVLEPGKAPG
ncbi:MAG: allophanate hydrolase [Endozoicomonas sp.]